MTTCRFALILGLIFVAIGVAGFIPALAHSAPGAHLGPNDDLLFGQFPVNGLHNAVHVLFGLWGLAASRATAHALSYARAIAIVYALLALAGVIPGLQTGFGLIPLYAKNVWLHGLLALTGAYFGWANRDPSRA